MKKIGFLYGLLCALYVPLQAHAEEGFYARASCYGIVNGCSKQLGFCDNRAEVGFGYAPAKEEAKTKALEDCKAKLLNKYPKYPYYDNAFNINAQNNLDKSIVPGQSGQFICGTLSYKPAIGVSEDAARTAEEKILEDIRNAGYTVGNQSCAQPK